MRYGLFLSNLQSIKEKISISWPVPDMKITQGFGENIVGFYKELGMKGHNGLDIKSPTGTACYAVCDGIVQAYADSSGGIAVELFSDSFSVEDKVLRIKFIYYPK